MAEYIKKNHEGKNKEQDRNAAAVSGNVTLSGNSEMLGRYSEAGKQFKIAYDGIDNVTGKNLHRSLKQISENKVNPNYYSQNINQQAGKSAEILDTAKTNAEYIKKGSLLRVSRTDDLGRVNDTRADQVTLDELGNIKSGSEVQIKFLGLDKKTGTPSFVDEVSQKKWQEHYPDGKYRVPSDQYDAIKTGLRNKISDLEKQNRTDAKNEQLSYLRKVEKNLQKSEVSKSEAISARLAPEKTTAKEIGKTASEAGAKAAMLGLAVGGGISLISNTISVLRGEKDVNVAICDTAKDTLITGASSFGIGFANTTLASVMKNSASELIRTLGDVNAPAYIIQTAIMTVRSMASLCKGEIDVDGFFTEIGRNGTILMASVQGAAIGQMLIPLPIVGSLAGGLVGSLLCGVIYDYTVGIKSFSQEIEAFSEQLQREMYVLNVYQAQLMKLDVERFRRETKNYNALGDYIGGNYTSEEFNMMLKVTYDYLRLPCPWGEGSFDDFMKNEAAVLRFT